MTDKFDFENKQDVELKKQLEKIDYSKYLKHGTITIRIREGKKTFTDISRTYID